MYCSAGYPEAISHFPLSHGRVSKPSDEDTILPFVAWHTYRVDPNTAPLSSHRDLSTNRIPSVTMSPIGFFSNLFLRGLHAASLASPTLHQVESRAVESRELDERATIKCAAGAHIFATRGHNAPEGNIGPLLTLVNRLLDDIPNSTWINTPYYTHVGEFAYVVTEIPNGTTILASNITTYAAACPKTPIVLVGYSEVRNAACSLLQCCFSR